MANRKTVKKLDTQKKKKAILCGDKPKKPC